MDEDENVSGKKTKCPAIGKGMCKVTVLIWKAFSKMHMPGPNSVGLRESPGKGIL